MTVSDTSSADSRFTDFLMKEYDSQSNGLFKNEELGDRRVNLHILISGGVLAIAGKVIAGLATAGLPGEQYEVLVLGLVLAGLLAAALFGAMTLRRILRRNYITDMHKMKIANIRRYFVGSNELYASIVPYPPKPIEEELRDLRKGRVIPGTFVMKNGGLDLTVIFVNSLIAIGLVLSLIALILLATGNRDAALEFINCNSLVTVTLFLICVAVFGFLAWWGQISLANSYYNQQWPRYE